MGLNLSVYDLNQPYSTGPYILTQYMDYKTLQMIKDCFVIKAFEPNKLDYL